MVSSLSPPQAPEVVNRLTKTLKGYTHKHTHETDTQTVQTHMHNKSHLYNKDKRGISSCQKMRGNETEEELEISEKLGEFEREENKKITGQTS